MVCFDKNSSIVLHLCVQLLQLNDFYFLVWPEGDHLSLNMDFLKF